MKKFLIVILSFLTLTIFSNTAIAHSNMANIRVLHASPDAPAVDIYANGNKILSNIPFGTISTYLSVPRGSYRIQVMPTGATTPVVIDEEVHVSRGKYYTFAASGRLSEIKLLRFKDRDVARESGDPRIRVVHLSPDAPAVDVGVVGQKPFIRHLSFMDKSGYRRLSAGTFDVSVRVAGTDTTVLTIPNVKIDNGLSATVYAIGLANGTPKLSAIIAVDGQ
ncbi:MAG: DUF4397 domain-containing protein [Patescibacteria group bacterium]|nr:DUF4397 domain-containing protein [Patescibacteria group bacterium]